MYLKKKKIIVTLFTKSTLSIDKQTSTAIREYKCDECGNIYHQKFSLEKHKLTHTSSVVDAEKLECIHCGALFQQARALATHIKNAHVESCFKCPVATCNAVLPNQKALNGHSSLHNGMCFYANAFLFLKFIQITPVQIQKSVPANVWCVTRDFQTFFNCTNTMS
jgi:hypothetical protein